MSGPDELIAAAKKARNNAYAPYSKFEVGCAVQLHDGRIASGTNVENSSYGLTVCSERHAIAAAVLMGAKPGDVTRVAIAGDSPVSVPPCGACRQVLSEFSSEQTQILIYNYRDDSVVSFTMGELLPEAFSPKNLTAS